MEMVAPTTVEEHEPLHPTSNQLAEASKHADLSDGAKPSPTTQKGSVIFCIIVCFIVGGILSAISFPPVMTIAGTKFEDSSCTIISVQYRTVKDKLNKDVKICTPTATTSVTGNQTWTVEDTHCDSFSCSNEFVSSCTGDCNVLYEGGGPTATSVSIQSKFEKLMSRMDFFVPACVCLFFFCCCCCVLCANPKA